MHQALWKSLYTKHLFNPNRIPITSDKQVANNYNLESTAMGAFTLHIIQGARHYLRLTHRKVQTQRSDRDKVTQYVSGRLRFIASFSDSKAPAPGQQQPTPLGEEGSMRATCWPCWRTGGEQKTWETQTELQENQVPWVTSEVRGGESFG